MREKVTRMVVAQRHRGPDDSGVEEVSQSPHVVFGHARLAIIDVSPDGHQPMRDSETGNVIVFNGEIYNFKVLREELKAKGCLFQTQSDTEVLLKAYAVWGRSCCSRLRGIFAFAVWDARSKELFIARDQLGVKPFYYCNNKNGFVFASEVLALLAGQIVEPRLSLEGLNSYLMFGSVQEPYTLIQGIRSLPAAHYGVVSMQGVSFERYWNPVERLVQVELGAGKTLDDMHRQVSDILRDAVSLQMVADVPLGAFLSGGIDSGTIVSLMRQVHAGPIKTFSIVFDTPQHDERAYAALVAKQNGTEHIELELTGAVAQAGLSDALQAFDQPSLDGLNTWFVSKLVKEAGLTVAMSGVGGDEIFVGYGGFEKPLSMQRWQKRVKILPAWLGSVISNNSNSEKIRKLGQVINYPLPAYFLSRQVFSEVQSTALLSADYFRTLSMWDGEAFDRILDDAKGLDPIDQISFYEMKSYMLSTLLRDTDQMSMAHSLEVRVPLISSRVVEKMMSIPGECKLNKETSKPFLVHAAGKGLPRECVDRPKQGFVLPFESWFKDVMKERVRAFCCEEHHPIFETRGLKVLWQQFLIGHVNWSRIWGLYVLNYWLIEHGVT